MRIILSIRAEFRRTCGVAGAMNARAAPRLFIFTLLLLQSACVLDATDLLKARRSPEHCYCETWSVGNALGALGGIDGEYDVSPGRTYSGGRSVSSSGKSCIPWLQVGT